MSAFLVPLGRLFPDVRRPVGIQQTIETSIQTVVVVVAAPQQKGMILRWRQGQHVHRELGCIPKRRAVTVRGAPLFQIIDLWSTVLLACTVVVVVVVARLTTTGGLVK